MTTKVASNVIADVLKNKNITDYAVESTAPSISAGTLTLDMTSGNDFDVSLAENVVTLTVSNWPVSGTLGKIMVRLAQDTTGGRTVAFPAGWKWPSGTAPTLPTAANEDIEIVAWTRDSGTTIYAAEVGQKFA